MTVILKAAARFLFFPKIIQSVVARTRKCWAMLFSSFFFFKHLPFFDTWRSTVPTTRQQRPHEASDHHVLKKKRKRLLAQDLLRCRVRKNCIRPCRLYCRLLGEGLKGLDYSAWKASVGGEKRGVYRWELSHHREQLFAVRHRILLS